MVIGACGIACDVCKMKPTCGGCLPGTDPKAGARQENLLKSIGQRCPVLDCAMKKNVDYCLSCTSFPCDVHYQAGFPYSRTMLDLFK